MMKRREYLPLQTYVRYVYIFSRKYIRALKRIQTNSPECKRRDDNNLINPVAVIE